MRGGSTSANTWQEDHSSSEMQTENPAYFSDDNAVGPSAIEEGLLPPNSVFTMSDEGALECMVAGGDSFTVYWNTSDGNAYAVMRSGRVAGQVKFYEDDEKTYLRHELQISGPDGDGYLTLFIDDDGDFLGQFDEIDITGKCQRLA